MKGFPDSVILSLLMILDGLFNIGQRDRHLILFGRPVAEIYYAASLGAKRAIRIVFPLGRLAAHRTFHKPNLSPLHYDFRFYNDTTKPAPPAARSRAQEGECFKM